MQQHGSKYFARTTLHPLSSDSPTLGMGSIGQNSTLSEHGHVAYLIKGNQEMQQHGSKYFAPPQPKRCVSRSKFNFSDHGHVECQIKGNHEMQQSNNKYFAHRTPPPRRP